MLLLLTMPCEENGNKHVHLGVDSANEGKIDTFGGFIQFIENRSLSYPLSYEVPRM